MRPSKEILALVVVVVIIVIAWTVHSLIDTQVTTAPDIKAPEQNMSETNAPNEQIAPAGTNGNPSEPTAPAPAGATQN